MLMLMLMLMLIFGIDVDHDKALVPVDQVEEEDKQEGMEIT